MNKDSDKTKEQLIAELAELRKKSKEQEDKLKAANQQLDAHNQQLQASEQTLKKQTHKLGERVKELNCFYEIAESVSTKESIEEILQDTANIIPATWQFPEIARGKVKFAGKEYVSQSFEETAWKQSADIVLKGNVVGSIEVYYLEKRPKLDEGPFMKEERNLINSIAHNISEAIELKQAEYEIKTIFNTAANGMRLIDNDFNIRKINNTFCEMVGLPENEIIGKKCYDVFWGEMCKTENCPLTKLQKNDDAIFDKEISKKRLDGKETPTILKAVPFKDIQGNIVGIVEDFKDITERKQAEEELTESEQKLKEAQSIALLSRWDLDLINNQLHWSDSIFELFEIDPEKFTASYDAFIEAIHPDDREKVDLAYSESLKTKLPYEIEHRLLMKDGRIKWVLEKCRTDYDLHGKPLRSIGVVQNITRRKQAEEAIKENEKLLSTIAENFPSSYLSVINSDFTIGFTSGQELKKQNIDPKQFEGLKVDQVFGDKTDFVIAKYKQTFRGEEQEFEMFFNDQHQLYKTVPLIANDGSIPRILSVVENITQRKHAEETLKESEQKLRESNTEKDKFFSIIAHDLKSPFNSIMGFSDILVEQVNKKDYDGIEEYAKIIFDSSQRAIDLLINLMEWSRSQTGRMEFWPEYLKIADITNETADLLRPIAEQKFITLKIEIPPKAIVFADKAMTSTVIRNLISNAIKFTNTGGKIKVSANEKPNELIISVSDTGVGIPKDRIEKLFVLSESYSTTGTNKEKGTGLGLILCKEFVEKHAGKIWVESKAGNGSQFYFTIPLNPV